MVDRVYNQRIVSIWTHVVMSPQLAIQIFLQKYKTQGIKGSANHPKIVNLCRVFIKKNGCRANLCLSGDVFMATERT